jgi:hypothetical protein
MQPIRRISSAAVLLVFALAAPSVAQTIYRCESDGVVTFSDRPCAADAVSHTPTARLSVVAPADELDRIAESNRAFIEQRRARLAEARAQAAQAEARSRAREPAVPSPSPVWWPAYRNDAAPAPSGPDRRVREQRQRSAAAGAGVIERRRSLLPRGRDRRPLDDGYQ